MVRDVFGVVSGWMRSLRSSRGNMKKKTNFEHDMEDASYTCLSAGRSSVEGEGEKH